jgi:hypothetical protein
VNRIVDQEKYKEGAPKVSSIVDHKRHEREACFVSFLEQAVENLLRQALPPGSGPLAEAQYRARATTQIVARVIVALEERVEALERGSRPFVGPAK